jgi:ankyrin repeat protein
MGFAGMSPLLEAILIESSDEVNRVLGNFPIDDQDNLLSLSTLHLAVYRPQHLELLLASGAKVNAKDRYGITPLMYATATGNSRVAIRLMEAGADTWLEDTLSKRNCLHFAKDRGNWNTILDILDYVRCFPKTSKADLCGLLTYVLLLWVEDNENRNKDSNHFQHLLNWGADPNVIHRICGDTLLRTLAYTVRNMVELKSLILNGFTKFDYLDSWGENALISTSYNNYELPDPGVIELLLSGGSDVNHRNHQGYTSLHVVLLQLRVYRSRYEPGNNWCHEKRSRSLDCIRVLLNRGADPSIGDGCNCHCSRLGCTPSQLVLKGQKGYDYPFSAERHDIWAFEYLDIVKEAGAPETVKCCLLDMLRLLKFQELELTHTCRRESSCFSGYFGHKIDKEEIEEIQMEEMEMIESLEQEMRDIEQSLEDDFEEQLLTEISLLLIKEKEYIKETWVKPPRLLPRLSQMRRESSANDKF